MLFRSIAFTQPVFEMKTLEVFLKRIAHLKLPLMVGIIPLRSHKHADFLHNEVPGMRIPEEFRDAMRNAGADAPKLGVKLSMDFLKEARPCVAGAYMMPPFQKYEVIEELLSVV